MTKCSLRHTNLDSEKLSPEGIYNSEDILLAHTNIMTNNLPIVKTNETLFRQIYCPDNLKSMKFNEKPYGDIAVRIRWHRALEGLNQNDYGLKAGLKRSQLNNWESGDYRLSIDGALALRRTYGLSLDFMYEGIDDALPMTLRTAWRDRP